MVKEWWQKILDNDKKKHKKKKKKSKFKDAMECQKLENFK